MKLLDRLRDLLDRIRGAAKKPPDAGGPPGIPQGQYGAAVHGKHTSYITRKPLSIEEDTQEDFPLAEPTTTRKLGGIQGTKSGSGDLAIGEASAFSPSKETKKQEESDPENES